MKLRDLWVGFGIDLDAKKKRLLREADAAFYGNDRVRCLEAIARLYEMFDAEFEVA